MTLIAKKYPKDEIDGVMRVKMFDRQLVDSYDYKMKYQCLEENLQLYQEALNGGTGLSPMLVSESDSDEQFIDADEQNKLGQLKKAVEAQDIDLVLPAINDSDQFDVFIESDDTVERKFAMVREGLSNEILSSKFGLLMSVEEVSPLLRVGHAGWLNDNIINFVFSRLMEQNSQIFCLESHFQIVLKPSFARAQKWLKNFDRTKHSLILIPINVNNVHWTLVTICIQTKQITYYDPDGNYDEGLVRLMSEFMSFANVGANWELIHAHDSPRQPNRYDCGVYICKYAEILSKNSYVSKNSFSQEDILNLRNEILLDIINNPY